MSGHKINPSSPTPLHGIEREGHIDEAAARRISVARLSINPDVEQKLEEVMTRVRRKNYDKDDKTRWGSLRKQFREHGSTGFSPKLTEENSFELEHANNDKYQYHPGGKPRQTSPNHDADSGYNEERASPRYHTPDAQPVPKPATPVKKSEPPVVKATLEQLRRGSLFRGEKPITEKPHNAWQGLLARHQQERAGRPGKHVTIKAGKPDEVEPPPRAPREAQRGPNERPPERQASGPREGPHPARRSSPHGRRPSPNRRPGSPGGRSRSPNRPVVSPRGRRSPPNRQPGSPSGRRRSPNRPGSPSGRRRSPNRPGSPAGRRRSPNRPSGSPDRRRRSPNRPGSPRRGNWPAARKLAGSPRGRRWPSPPRQADGSRGRSRSPNQPRGPPNQRGRSPNPSRTGYPNEIYDSPGQRRNQPRDEGLSSAERRRQSMPDGKNDPHSSEDKPRRQSIPSHGNNRTPDKRNPTSKDEVWKAEQPEDRMVVDDGRLIRSPPTSRPASSERRITPVEEVEPTVGSPTGLISAMKPTDGRRRPTPNKKPRKKSVVFVDPIPKEDVQQEKDNRPPSSKDPAQPVLHQPARDPGPLPSTSAAFLGSPPEYGKENRPTSAKQPVQPQPNKPPGLIASTTDSIKNDAPGKGQENMPPKAKSPVPPSTHSSVPPSAKSPVPPKVKSPVPPHAPQPTKAPQPIPSTSGTQNIHAPKPGQDRLPSASKPPQIRTTSPTTKAPTSVTPPKNKEDSVPASIKTVDETKKDGSFHDLQMDLAPPKKDPSTSIGKQSQAGGSQRLTPETPANSAQKNVTNPTPEVTQAQQKDASAKAAPTGPVKAKSPKPKLQPPLQENGSVSKKKPSFSEKKYQTTDEPVKTAVIAKEVKPLERKLERKDTAQVLKDKDLNMDTEFLDDRNGSGKTLIKDRPAKKKGDWMASKKTQGTSKRHGKKKAVSRKDAHIQELSGTEKACYTCAGYCMCCACCYRLFKDDDDDEVFRRRKCITVFLAIALAIVLVGLIVGLCIGLGGLGGPAPTSPPRFILVPQNLNPIINVNGNQPVSAGTPAGGTGTAAGTANDSATATDGATPGGTTG
ncbi:uncharacterized protein LOC144887860 isoform X4 [Branchiostoma floridae x Branchiostoma japonicum]